MSFLSRLRRKVKRVLKREEISTQPIPYYPQQKSCQIPTLSFLLERFLGQRTTGIFVEIGANDGILVSNTWGLAQKGWNGYLVEPVPEFAERCRLAYRDNPRVRIAEIAIAAAGVENIKLHLAGVLTTANPKLLEEYSNTSWAKRHVSDESISVKATTLDKFLAANGIPTNFDLLVVDVEGFEKEVFASFDLGHWAPKMLIVELCDTHQDLQSTANQDAELYLRIASNGYVVVYKDQINTVFVQKQLWEKCFYS